MEDDINNRVVFESGFSSKEYLRKIYQKARLIEEPYTTQRKVVKPGTLPPSTDISTIRLKKLESVFDPYQNKKN